jgi:hypothetical protein
MASMAGLFDETHRGSESAIIAGEFKADQCSTVFSHHRQTRVGNKVEAPIITAPTAAVPCTPVTIEFWTVRESPSL